MSEYLLAALLVLAFLLCAPPLFPVMVVFAILILSVLLLIFFTELVIWCLHLLVFGRDEFEDF